MNYVLQLTNLGDKSAHTATIHLPQMLYIWPYIAFFSAPLLITPLLQPLRHLLPQRLQRIYEQYVPSRPVLKLPSSLWIVLGLTAVHFNTIVHPYTLADNRHYVFYVFRMLLRHPAIKYLAVPVYCVCAWLTLQALGSPSNNASEQMSKRDSRPTSYGPEGSPCQISFILVWLATTTLSLVSAPLVEPRYFIVPWILWRLHVATGPASLPTPKKEANRKAYDVRPSLETAWLFAVNAAITYVFIRRPFEWASEPGKMQRFLW
jgi:alpha-1,2-glucosyltransferase